MKIEIKYLLIIIVSFLITGGVIFFTFFGDEIGNSDEGDNTLNEFTTFESKEFEYSLKYPSEWWHNNISMDNLISEPDLGIRTFSLEAFGTGNEADHRVPFAETDMRVSMAVTVYFLAEGTTEEELMADINYSDEIISEQRINGPLVKVFSQDNSNHEIESARMFTENYLFSGDTFYYLIDFTSRSPQVINGNRNLIKTILSSFKIYE